MKSCISRIEETSPKLTTTIRERRKRTDRTPPKEWAISIIEGKIEGTPGRGRSTRHI